MENLPFSTRWSIKKKEKDFAGFFVMFCFFKHNLTLFWTHVEMAEHPAVFPSISYIYMFKSTWTITEHV